MRRVKEEDVKTGTNGDDSYIPVNQTWRWGFTMLRTVKEEDVKTGTNGDDSYIPVNQTWR